MSYLRKVQESINYNTIVISNNDTYKIGCSSKVLVTGTGSPYLIFYDNTDDLSSKVHVSRILLFEERGDVKENNAYEQTRYNSKQEENTAAKRREAEVSEGYGILDDDDQESSSISSDDDYRSLTTSTSSPNNFNGIGLQDMTEETRDKTTTILFQERPQNNLLASNIRKGIDTQKRIPSQDILNLNYSGMISDEEGRKLADYVFENQIIHHYSNQSIISKYIRHKFLTDSNISIDNKQNTNKILRTYHLIYASNSINDIITQMNLNKQTFISYDSPTITYNKKSIIYKNSNDQIKVIIERINYKLIRENKQISNFDIGFYLKDNEVMFQFLGKKTALNEQDISLEKYHYLKNLLLNNTMRDFTEQDKFMILQSTQLKNHIHKELQNIYEPISYNPCFIFDYSKLMSARIGNIYYNDHTIKITKYNCAEKNLEILTGIRKGFASIQINSEWQGYINTPSVVFIYPNNTNTIIYNTSISDFRISDKIFNLGNFSFNYTEIASSENSHSLVQSRYISSNFDNLLGTLETLVGIALLGMGVYHSKIIGGSILKKYSYHEVDNDICDSTCNTVIVLGEVIGGTVLLGMGVVELL